MNLEELVQLYGIGIIVRRSNHYQEEPFRIIEDKGDVYIVEGCKSDVRYTQKKDADGYELVRSRAEGMTCGHS